MRQIAVKLKNLVEIYATCVYISAIIYLVALMTDAYTKYVIPIRDLAVQGILSIIIILFFGFLIFLIVMVSSHFRKILFRAFGAE